MKTIFERNTAMWAEAGIVFRSNLVSKGGVIGLHAHSYDHVSLVTSGWFSVKEILPNGEVKEYQLAAKDFKTDNPNFTPSGYRITIPAWHKHEFTCLEGNPAEVLCMWAEGFDEETEGEDSC